LKHIIEVIDEEDKVDIKELKLAEIEEDLDENHISNVQNCWEVDSIN